MRNINSKKPLKNNSFQCVSHHMNCHGYDREKIKKEAESIVSEAFENIEKIRENKIKNDQNA